MPNPRKPRDTKPRAQFPKNWVSRGLWKQLSKSARAVLMVLVARANSKTNSCYPGRQLIMLESGIKHENTLDKAIRELEALNIIEKQLRANTSNLYVLQFTRNAKPFVLFPHQIVMNHEDNIAPVWALLSPAQQTLFVAIISCFDQYDSVELSRSDLKEMTGLVRNPDITEAIAALERFNLIETEVGSTTAVRSYRRVKQFNN